MADKPAAERTEQPTPERLRKARQEGRVPTSGEVPSALMIALLLIVLGLTAATLYGWFAAQVRRGLAFEHAGALDGAAFVDLLRRRAGESLLVIVPFLLAGAAVSVFGSLLVGGWAFAPKALRLDLGRISPVNGLKGLLSFRSAVYLSVSVAKLLVILAIVYVYLEDKLPACLALRWSAPAGVVVAIARLVFGLAGRVVAALMVIAGMDLLFQRWKHKRDLRMTRQEVKEERRQHEISPELRGRIRAIQIEMVRKRMLQEVPQADVVLTNPTHVAVAIRYDAGSMQAPQVVAKGADFLAEKIRDIARAHNVPVLHRPELARALYATVEPGQTIPEALYVAVAEVLAVIYRLRNRQQTAGGAAE